MASEVSVKVKERKGGMLGEKLAGEIGDRPSLMRVFS
jgi:hypothetical protein